MGSQAVTAEVSGTSKSFHIFGSGISFSVSPIIHNAAFKAHGLPHHYDIRQSPSIDGVADLIADARFGGGSVTMPHKLQVHRYCDHISDTAKSIGAINTLIVSGEGDDRQIEGDNTDWSGLYNIINSYKRRSDRGVESGLVIGAGGASRAALYAMHRAGIVNIYLVNRTQSVAESVREAFADMFTITVLPQLRDLPEGVQLIIGTIPADVTSEEMFSNIFTSGGLCIDMAYKPRQTPLLSAAKKHAGWDTITGIQVLLAQAFDQYRLWTGREPPLREILDAVSAHAGGEKVEIDGKL